MTLKLNKGYQLAVVGRQELITESERSVRTENRKL